MEQANNEGNDPVVVNENDKSKEKQDSVDSTEEDKQKATVTNTSVVTSTSSDESYVNDRQYAIVLAQMMESQHREKVYKWIERYISIIL